MRKNIIILFALLSVVLTGCWNEPEYIDVIRLGARNKTITLETTEYGDSAFYLISNVDYKLDVVSGDDWVTIVEANADSIAFSYPSNNGFRRSAEIVISFGTRVDHLKVLQPGKYEMKMELSELSIEVPAEGGSYSVDLLTNVLQRDLEVEVSNANVCRNIVLENNRLSFDVAPATSRDTKTYTITVYTLDGWGEKVETILYVIQKSK
jgi:hypothetical protein